MTIINKPLLVLILLAWLALSIAAAAYSAEIETQVVVVNNSVDESQLSRSKLRAIFGMKLRSWNDGTPIRVFILPDAAPEHVHFCKQVLNVFPYQLRSLWDRLVFSGTGQAPIEVSSEEEMRQQVKRIDGAIGYLRRTLVDESIRVLDIE